MSTHDEDGPGTEFLERLGREVRRRRQAVPLTVQALADRAGLSRRMLTQIEQSTANPSLVTISKVAHALGTDFATLVAPPTAQPVHVSTQPVEAWRSAAGSNALLHVASARRDGPELWEWTIQAGDRYQAQPDPPGSEELILVTAGTLRLEVDGEQVDVGAGRSVRLATDRPYAYAATEDGPTTFVRVAVVSARRPL
jgi:transcriptional regulator with XRE-family HTH domain